MEWVQVEEGITYGLVPLRYWTFEVVDDAEIEPRKGYCIKCDRAIKPKYKVCYRCYRRSQAQAS